MTTSAPLRRIAIAGAYATCCFLNCWVAFGLGRVFYFMGRSPFASVIGPVLICQALIFVAVLCGWRLLRGSPHADKIFLAACIVPAAATSRAFLLMLPLDIYGIRMGVWFWPVFALLAAAFLYFILWHHRRAAGIAKDVLAHAWPVLAFLYGQAAWQVYTKASGPMIADGPLAGSIATAAHAAPGNLRVVWIVFDELSQPAAAASPGFRAFANQGFSATHTVPAATATEGAMPSLIDGEIEIPMQRRDARTLIMRDGSIFGARPNVFDAARDLGLDTAVAGWYHPYCRVLAHSLSQCAWTPGWPQAGLEELPAGYPGNSILTRFELQVRVLPLVGKHLAVLEIKKRLKTQVLEYLLPRARDMVSDPRLGLVMVHLPAPHPPHAYDAQGKQINVQGRWSYSDSVAQADGILQNLLATLENSGLGDRTAVIVSSDHGFRADQWRVLPGWTPEDERVSHLPGIGEVPFIVRIPAAGEPVTFDRPFNAVVTRRLIEAILAGRVQTYRQITELVANAQR